MEYLGGSPVEMKKTIVQRIEDCIQWIEGIDRILATASEDFRSVSVELQRGADKRLERELQRYTELSLVELESVCDYEVTIELSRAALRAYGLTLNEVAALVQESSLDLARIDVGIWQNQTEDLKSRLDLWTKNGLMGLLLVIFTLMLAAGILNLRGHLPLVHRHVRSHVSPRRVHQPDLAVWLYPVHWYCGGCCPWWWGRTFLLNRRRAPNR